MQRFNIMRLTNYLTEETLEDIEQEKKLVNEMIETLEHDCSEIISVYKKANGFLYRGSKKSIKMYDYITPRPDRQPKDTPQIYHDMIDDIFKKKYGWRARSEGVFASGEVMAKEYGKAYLFFPVNGYKYLWSEKIQDLYSDVVENFDLFTNEHWAEWSEEYGYKTGNGHWIGDNDGEYKTINDITKISDWTETKNWVENGRDIFSVKFKDAVWIGFTWEPEIYYDVWLTDHEEELFYKYLTDKLDINTYENTNLEQCIRKNQIDYNQREAMFKCKGYYLVNTGTTYIKSVRNYFGIFK